MSDKLAVTVDAEPIDVVINIKVSGDLPDDGTDGQVLMRVGGKNVWADPPAGPGGGIAKEIDPTVPAWAKRPNKPKYTAEEVGAASKGDVEQLSKEVADKQPKGDYALKSEIPNMPEPYTLPVASADTLGGVKVGEGLHMDGDVLGVKPEQPMRLINAITTTEEVSIIDITSDNKGQSFAVKTAYIVFTPGEVASTAADFAMVGKASSRKDSLSAVVYTDTLIRDAKEVKGTSLRYIVSIKNGRMFVDKADVVRGAGHNVWVNTQLYGRGFGLEEHDYIRAVGVNALSNAVWPIGSKLEVYEMGVF